MGEHWNPFGGYASLNVKPLRIGLDCIDHSLVHMNNVLTGALTFPSNLTKSHITPLTSYKIFNIRLFIQWMSVGHLPGFDFLKSDLRHTLIIGPSMPFFGL